MITTGGQRTGEQRNGNYIAAGLGRLLIGRPIHPYLLVAMNELGESSAIGQIEGWLAEGKSILIDSGVFALANNHAKAHGMPLHVAIALPPDQIDGFDDLFTLYVDVMTRLGDQCWGYIEIDQGGRENKTRIRERLEKLGLCPMPVYHPMSDGWDYFDTLAKGYDRMCVGNAVQAERKVRKRLLATMYERRRAYPHLWIHMLGMTPNEWMNAYPIDSCDSSSWMAMVRWAAPVLSSCAMKSFCQIGPEFRYRYDVPGDDEQVGGNKAIALGAYDAGMLMRNWRALRDGYRDELGADPNMYLGGANVQDH